MHEFSCSCGHSIVIDSPSPNAGYLIWDSEVDSSIERRRATFQGFLAALQSGQRDAWMRYFYGTTSHNRLQLKTDVDVLEDILSQQDSQAHFCYRCDDCGRLHLQRGPGVSKYSAYAPED